MVIDVKPLLRVAPALQAAVITNRNAKLVTKKKVNSKDLIHTATDTVLGATFIKIESDLIEGL